MASSEWEEVRRLAADFQRIQLSSAIQKLSERNCIEIVNKLVESKLIEVIYTLDGKEYLTPARLGKEIHDELIYHGGRINLVDLQQILSIDFFHIEAKAAELVKHEKSLKLVLGQLIHKDYMNRLSEEINDQLQEAGRVTIAELSKSCDLPASFLSEMIDSRIGSIIHGQRESCDQGVIFTKDFVDRHSAQIRGVFSAVTKPTPVLSIVSQYQFPERLFFGCLKELIDSGRLNGSITGGRHEKSVFTPELYAKTQNAWIDSFLSQNGYLEYDTLTRLGVTDVRTFIKKRFKTDSLLFLSSCCMGQQLQDRVEASVDEALSTGSWLDVTPLLPSSLSIADIRQLLHQLMKTKEKSGARVVCDTIVCSENFLAAARALFDPLMTQKAQRDAKIAPQLLIQVDKKAIAGVSGGGADNRKDRKDDRRKKAAGGGGSSKGGGTGISREIKTKKMKKGRGRDVENEDEYSASSHHEEVSFMSLDEVEDVLSKNLSDCPEEMTAELAEEFYRPLQRAYQEIAKTIFLSLSTSSSDSSKRRKDRGDLEDKITGLLNNIRLFERGIRQFSDEELENLLTKYLLRTLCSDLTNLLLSAVAGDHLMSEVDPVTLNTGMRAGILIKLPDDLRAPLSKLHNTLSGKDPGEFFSSLEKACDSNACDVMLRKLDKKKERQIVFNHRQALREQLKNEMDPAMALHLAVVLAFQNNMQCMLHAPGKLVPQVISYLSDHITLEHHKLFLRYQGLVQKHLGLGRDQDTGRCNKESGEQGGGGVAFQLELLLDDVKEIALAKKKSTSINEG